jgi:tRNA threonylcarbamoyladenosine biosynthesis protein TsaB
MAIETSCRLGGLALGMGGEIVSAMRFDASQRHATQLIGRMEQLLRAAGLRPGDLGQLYVSAGPGSFTGLRVGITVARTLVQAVGDLRCIAVPTIDAVAENARSLAWDNLAVLMDAKDQSVYAACYARRGDDIIRAGRPAMMPVTDFLGSAPRPLLVMGEALRHVQAGDAADIVRAEESLDMPAPENVWRLGRRRASEGKFVDYHRLVPFYSRRPEAERLWEERREG